MPRAKGHDEALPLPLVRIQRGPDGIKRTRFWPFFGRLEADGLVETQFLWLLIRLRHEDYLDSERDGVYVIPFWQSTTRTDKETGEVSKWRKFFPFYRFESDDEGESGAFLCLDPFQRNTVIDRHYGWLYKLWEWRQRGPVRRERALWGLWRRERDAGEDRRSLMGLWARRSYHKEGKKVRETSLLFGLLRWRSTEDEGTDLLRPAIPGPGWPGKREPPQGISPSPRR